MLEVVREEVALVHDGALGRERLVVAPVAGRFSPLPADTFTTEGEWVEPGQALATVRAGERAVPVVSAFRGWVMGMLGLPGQPVRAGEALFWIREA
jgi:biotin carboxyl carrier protein